MFDYIRAAAAVPRVSVANPKENTKNIIKLLRAAGDKGADICVFPELCITAYTCQDLFFQESLCRAAKEGLLDIVKETESSPAAVVGLPLEIGSELYNCAVFIAQGVIAGIVPKTFLPNYNEFYEKRWFSSSENLTIDILSSKSLGLDADYLIPVSRNLIFDLYGKVRLAVEICEDLWSPLPPSCFAALNSAELILNLSASNETIAKSSYRNSLIAQQSARTISGYVYASAGAGESTSDLVFSGSALIAQNGKITAVNKNYIEDECLVISDIDLGILRSDRKKLKTFADTARVYGALQSAKLIKICEGELNSNGEYYPIDAYPFVPHESSSRQRRCDEIFQLQVAGLKKRIEVTSSRPVIGVSGGLDSTLALLVAVAAVKKLGKAPSEVVGITMPCFGTTGRTYNNALKLMQGLGITIKEVNIKEACMLHFRDIGHDSESCDLTYENAQARERTQVLMDYAGRVGGFVVGTGDLSELALGWCTYNADHMSMYNVNASIPKTLVRSMVDAISKMEDFSSSHEVLQDIIDTPISPELLPPDTEGKIAQKTEDLVGPYSLHDFFLYYVLRYGFEPKKIYHLASRAFEGEYSPKVIKKWLCVFYRRFFTQQFKRNCMPDAVKVGSICLSPRGDWRMPADASFEAWLSQAMEL